MKEIIIAFDIDHTLISNETGLGQEHLNLDVFTLLVSFSKISNTKIYVWSGGGQDYAEQIVRKYGLDRYVDRCFGKHEYDDTLYGKVDIAVDDEMGFSMGDKNLIVNKL